MSEVDWWSKANQGSGDRLARGAVVPDGGGEGEQALGHPRGHSGQVASAVHLRVELALEGVVDRLDELTDRRERPLTRVG